MDDIPHVLDNPPKMIIMDVKSIRDGFHVTSKHSFKDAVFDGLVRNIFDKVLNGNIPDYTGVILTLSRQEGKQILRIAADEVIAVLVREFKQLKLYDDRHEIPYVCNRIEGNLIYLDHLPY